MKKQIKSLLIIISCTAFSGVAQATLIGDIVDYDRIFNGSDISAQGPSVVGAGIEFSDFNVLTVDVDDSSIRFNWITFAGYSQTGADGIPQYLLVTGLNWIGMPNLFITGIEVTTSSIVGLDLSDFSFTEDSVRIEMGGVGSLSSGSFIQIELLTAVPAPAVTALFGLGLAGLGFTRRKLV
jgi:hypothetical protein